MRKQSEINDFDDDYSEDEDVDNEKQTATTSRMQYENIKSLSSHFGTRKFIYLLLFLSQTNK
jgi:hypothetical protein